MYSEIKTRNLIVVIAFTRHREDEDKKPVEEPDDKKPSFLARLGPGLITGASDDDPPASEPTARQAHSSDLASAGRCS